MSSPILKLSSPATGEFWEVPILHEDDDLLALNKPARLLTSPDRYDADRPNLMKLLHAGITEGKAWARERGLSYLMNPHRLDFETTGVLLLAKNKPVLVQLSNLFGSEKPAKIYLAIVQGVPDQESFEVDAPLAPHPSRLGCMCVAPARGKNSRTLVRVRDRFRTYALVECQPLTGRTHQIRIHLKHAGHPLCGDNVYGGRPLLLSKLKPGYRLKKDREERPLLDRPALHAFRLTLPHPVTGTLVTIEAPLPKDMTVALKYLQRFKDGILAGVPAEGP